MAALRVRAVAVVSGEGLKRAVRRARRAHARRRPDAEPLDLRAARRDPRGARRGGARAALLPQRGDGRRARRRALRQAGGGGPRRSASRPALAAAVELAAPTVRWSRTRRRCTRRSRGCAPAPSPRPPAPTPQGRFAPGRGRRLPRRGGRSPGASPRRRCAHVLVALADGAELLSVLAGEDAPLDPPAVAALLDGELGDGRARAAPRRAGRLLVAARRGVAASLRAMPPEQRLAHGSSWWRRCLALAAPERVARARRGRAGVRLRAAR